MANDPDSRQDFDDLEFPAEPFEALPMDGMPDPTAQTQAMDDAQETPTEEAEEPADPKAAKKGKKAKKGKEPKAAKEPKAKKPKPAKAPKPPKEPRSSGRFAVFNPYTVMLGVALAAIVLANVCLFLEFHAYGFDWKATAIQNIGQGPR